MVENRCDDTRRHRMNDISGLLPQLGDVAPDDDDADDVSVRVLQRVVPAVDHAPGDVGLALVESLCVDDVRYLLVDISPDDGFAVGVLRASGNAQEMPLPVALLRRRVLHAAESLVAALDEHVGERPRLALVIQKRLDVCIFHRAVADQGMAPIDGVVPDVPVPAADQVLDVVDVRVQPVRDQGLLHLHDVVPHDSIDRRDHGQGEDAEKNAEFETNALMQSFYRHWMFRLLFVRTL